MAQTKRPRGRPFQKGQSGNPGGLPAGFGDLRSACRAHTQTAINVLVKAMNGEDPRLATTAAEALLDRGWGRPPAGDSGAGEGQVVTVRIVHQRIQAGAGAGD